MRMRIMRRKPLNYCLCPISESVFHLSRVRTRTEFIYQWCQSGTHSCTCTHRERYNTIYWYYSRIYTYIYIETKQSHSQWALFSIEKCAKRKKSLEEEHTQNWFKQMQVYHLWYIALRVMQRRKNDRCFVGTDIISTRRSRFVLLSFELNTLLQRLSGTCNKNNYMVLLKKQLYEALTSNSLQSMHFKRLSINPPRAT